MEHGVTREIYDFVSADTGTRRNGDKERLAEVGSFIPLSPASLVSLSDESCQDLQ